ncbi:MAG TPA: class I fructose-bisphosphate aldolase [Alphaproteobacteria bacterium]|nr:class I fructose-bisphosphate aldolase [Alphaproteobacteria bacterium]
MKLTKRVRDILSNYEGDNAGTKANLARLLMEGRLGGTGKMIILPVDQGYEHGPARSFAVNPPAYDPVYHHQLAIDAGLSAYAAPLGALEVSSPQFAGQIPTILKVNSANSLMRNKEAPDQAITGTVEDALRLGCSAIGFTTYPGSDQNLELQEEISEMIREAKSVGLPSVVWCYARGGAIPKDMETAMDVIAYGAHMACLLGAHVIKVKLPSDKLYLPEAKTAFEKNGISTASQADRVREVVRSCFNGKRIVVFSGGEAKGENSVIQDARDIAAGGGNGSIIGRNCFQRPREDALKLLDQMVRVFQGKDQPAQQAAAA